MSGISRVRVVFRAANDLFRSTRSSRGLVAGFVASCISIAALAGPGCGGQGGSKGGGTGGSVIGSPGGTSGSVGGGAGASTGGPGGGREGGRGAGGTAGEAGGAPGFAGTTPGGGGDGGGSCVPVTAGEASSACPLETMNVPTNGAVVQSQGVYAALSSFRVVVSGMVVWGACDQVTCPNAGACGYTRIGDANYLSDDCFGSTYMMFGATKIALLLNGSIVPWGPFSATHVYSAVVPGNDGHFSFRYNDCGSCYADNSGSLVVSIFAQ